MMKQELIIKKEELPEGWNVKKLGEIAEYINGRAFKPSEWEKKGFPIIRIQNLTSSSECTNYFSGEVEDKYIIKDGELLLAWSATLDVFIWNKGRAVLNQHIFKVIPNNNLITKEFLFYLLKNQIEEIKSETHGSGMVHITKPKLLNLKILLPPLPIQQKIVSKLDKQMAQIEMMKKEAEKEKEASDDIFLSLLEKFFPKKINSPLPPGWRLVRLREITSLLGDGLHGTPVYSDNGEYYFINGNNLSDGKILIKSDSKKVSLEEYNKYKKILNERTIFVSINGTLGNVAFYNDEKIVLSKSVCYFNLLENIDKYFIKTILNSKYFLDYCNKNATGSTIKNVSLESMRNFLIPLPALSVQQEIVKKITKQSNEINIIKEQISQKLSAISQLPSSILNEVFGQYKIPEEV